MTALQSRLVDSRGIKEKEALKERRCVTGHNPSGESDLMPHAGSAGMALRPLRRIARSQSLLFDRAEYAAPKRREEGQRSTNTRGSARKQKLRNGGKTEKRLRFRAFLPGRCSFLIHRAHIEAA